MLRDEAWYEHTIQGRAIIWWLIRKDWLRRKPNDLAWWVAFHLPRTVVLFTLVRIAQEAIIDPAEQPSLMNAYSEFYHAWAEPPRDV